MKKAIYNVLFFLLTVLCLSFVFQPMSADAAIIVKGNGAVIHRDFVNSNATASGIKSLSASLSVGEISSTTSSVWPYVFSSQANTVPYMWFSLNDDDNQSITGIVVDEIQIYQLGNLILSTTNVTSYSHSGAYVIQGAALQSNFTNSNGDNEVDVVFYRNGIEVARIANFTAKCYANAIVTDVFPTNVGTDRNEFPLAVTILNANDSATIDAYYTDSNGDTVAMLVAENSEARYYDIDTKKLNVGLKMIKGSLFDNSDSSYYDAHIIVNNNEIPYCETYYNQIQVYDEPQVNTTYWMEESPYHYHIEGINLISASPFTLELKQNGEIIGEIQNIYALFDAETYCEYIDEDITGEIDDPNSELQATLYSNGVEVYSFTFLQQPDTPDVDGTTTQDSSINPNTATFDKSTSAQADITTTMTLNGNTLVSITNGTSTLVSDTDYSVSENTVTIMKDYLAAQAVGTTTLTFNFSAGEPQTLTITVSDSTASSTQRIVPIAGGWAHTLAIKEDGTVWAWGYNCQGQLGNGNSGGEWYQFTDGVDEKTPVQVPGITDAVAVAGGTYHSMVLKKDGTVWNFGSNYYGEFGNGTFGGDVYAYDEGIDCDVPFQMSGLSNIKAISSRVAENLVIKNDGTVWTFGTNLDGTSTTSRNDLITTIPMQVQGLNSIVKTSCGRNFYFALRSDNTVWTWGSNQYGQLGDGTTVNRTIPAQIEGLSDIVDISAGLDYGLALKKDGTVYAWGRNECGQLGDETTVDKLTPIMIHDLSGIVSIASGSMSLALKDDATVWSWGYNYSGGLGDGNTTNKSLPTQISDLNDVSAIACGQYHAMALKKDGTLWTWGDNWCGDLGVGTAGGSYANSYDASVDTLSPVQVLNLTGVMQPETSTIEDIAVTGVSLNKATTTITAGQTEQLTATVTPDNATDKNVTWSVFSQSGSDIATVSAEGLVTAVNPGTAVIRATSNYDVSKYVECIVTVNAVSATINIGDYIQFGHYYGQPILWRVINIDDQGSPMLLTEKILCLKAFDAGGDGTDGRIDSFRITRGSNYWEKSNIREWLNSDSSRVAFSQQPPDDTHVCDGYWNYSSSNNDYADEPGFLNNFTQNELASIKPITHPCLISPIDELIKDGGSGYSVPYSFRMTDNINNFYDNAYENVEDIVFLPDLYELQKYVYDRGWQYLKKPTALAVQISENKDSRIDTEKYWFYWTRTPHMGSSGETLSCAPDDHFWYVFDVNGSVGIAPSLCLKSGVSSSAGDGSEGNPYIITGELASATSEDSVASDKNALTFDTIKGANTSPDNIIANLSLPTSGLNGTTISWIATPAGIIAADGSVTRPAVDTAVTLTATISKGTTSDTKEFVVTVKAAISNQPGFNISSIPNNTLKLGDDFFDMSSDAMNDPQATTMIASLLKDGINKNIAYFKFGGKWYAPFELTEEQFLDPAYALTDPQVNAIRGFNKWYKAGSEIVDLRPGTYTITPINQFSSGFRITANNVPAAAYFNVYKTSSSTLINSVPIAIGSSLNSMPAVFSSISDLEVWIYSDAAGTDKIAELKLEGGSNAGILDYE